jgi:hypothetical protein
MIAARIRALAVQKEVGRTVMRLKLGGSFEGLVGDNLCCPELRRIRVAGNPGACGPRRGRILNQALSPIGENR